MKALDAYLRTEEITQREFAELIGCSQSLVSQWLSGDVEMTADWALEIERRTKGALLRQHLLPRLYRGMAA
jgi:DNA-binding transcriptional regulator YdaS (Cro superfamily)